MADQIKRKPNRAKARLQRRAEDMEAQRQEAAAEASTMPDPKAKEQSLMDHKLAALGLTEHNVSANGHCLYAAFSDQLAVRCSVEESIRSLRTKAAQYIRTHQDDFLPFLVTEDGAANLDIYTKEIEDTPRWGGEMEIIALARDLGVAVELIQAEGGVLQFEEQHKKKVMLARYKHMYSLGAHFNSLRPKE